MLLAALRPAPASINTPSLLSTLSRAAQTLKYALECVHSLDNLMPHMESSDVKCQFVYDVCCIVNLAGPYQPLSYNGRFY